MSKHPRAILTEQMRQQGLRIAARNLGGGLSESCMEIHGMTRDEVMFRLSNVLAFDRAILNGAKAEAEMCRANRE
jgi:hypothetical protein